MSGAELDQSNPPRGGTGMPSRTLPPGRCKTCGDQVSSGFDRCPLCIRQLRWELLIIAAVDRIVEAFGWREEQEDGGD